MPTNDGTIDVTNLVDKMRSSFVLSQVLHLMDWLVTIGFVAFFLKVPFFSRVVKQLLTFIVKKIANSAEMLAFFTNTAMRKSWQAADYVKAVQQKRDLPKDATDEQYEHAERLEITAFRNLTRLTN